MFDETTEETTMLSLLLYNLPSLDPKILEPCELQRTRRHEDPICSRYQYAIAPRLYFSSAQATIRRSSFQKQQMGELSEQGKMSQRGQIVNDAQISAPPGERLLHAQRNTKTAAQRLLQLAIRGKRWLAEGLMRLKVRALSSSV